MHEALNSIRLVHGANPGAKGGIREAVAKARDRVADNENGVRRMRGEDRVGDDVTDRGHDGNAALPKLHVDASVREGGNGVAGKGGQEDERDDGVTEIVVVFQLDVTLALDHICNWSESVRMG